MPEHDNNIKKYQCVPCDLCGGSGLFSTSNIDGDDITYTPCEQCGGYQCFRTDTDFNRDRYYGPCNEHCGHNRESLKENWTKM
jgi:hypothetical protein